MSRADDLFAEVYAAPEEDAPREKLARRLKGTARGEYLRLSLVARPSRAEKAQAKELLAANVDEWLAPLRGALAKRTVKWERGFPVAGRLAAQPHADDAEAIVGLPALATLRRLDLELPNTVPRESWIERVIFDGPLRGLREVTGYRPALVARMLRAIPPFAVEVLEASSGYDVGSLGELDAAFADGRGLPRLRELKLTLAIGVECAPALYSWLWTTAVGRRIERLSVNLDAYMVAAWRNALEEHAGPKSGHALRRLVFFGRNHLVLDRSEAGWSRLTVTPSPKLFPPEKKKLASVLDELRRAGVDVAIGGEEFRGT
jgi:hypothetical protein